MNLPTLRVAAPRFIALAAITFLAAARSFAAEDHRDCPHVRASAQRIKEAVAIGTGRSATFRSLVEEIDASDGLVMLEEGDCRFGVRACLRPDILAAGPHRLLVIVVVPHRAPGCQLIEAIGHELYHAVEVLREPGVRSFPDLFSLFQRIGTARSWRFETEEAINAGLRISREACR